MTTTVNLTCRGTVTRLHDKRTAYQFHDKYWSWESTSQFRPGLYGTDRKVLRVPGAAPGEDSRMQVTIACSDPACTVSLPIRWEDLHARLDEARDRGQSEIPIN